MSSKRSSLLDRINQERERQADVVGSELDAHNTPNDWIAIASYYLVQETNRATMLTPPPADEFERENEFDRIMEEVIPISIPTDFIRGIQVTMRTGAIVKLSGEELLSPLPLSGKFSWAEMAENFESIDDVEVLVDIPGLRKSVIKSVKNILKNHFDSYKD